MNLSKCIITYVTSYFARSNSDQLFYMHKR